MSEVVGAGFLLFPGKCHVGPFLETEVYLETSYSPGPTVSDLIPV